MNTTLRWITFEATMIAILPVNGMTAPKLDSFNENRIRMLENSL